MELKQFLRAATMHERGEVAGLCNNSVAYLYQLAGGHRFASALLAIQIERKTQQVAAGTKGRLKAVPRESLVRHPEIFAAREGPMDADPLR
ncbi:MAG: hypothetical protein OXK72_03230 [Gammaproteobacteria bacterium]|nr:hypothetical protein [Gammaproteobacteria bacterium]MDE0411066.1 hypothetical protein [Gammaproteobacteria bacterium]